MIKTFASTGAIVGDDCVMIVDAQATSKMAEKVIARERDWEAQLSESCAPSA
jgi:hypothetical protein